MNHYKIHSPINSNRQTMLLRRRDVSRPRLAQRQTNTMTFDMDMFYNIVMEHISTLET